MKKFNFFENIVTDRNEEIFEEILSEPGIKIERIISSGQATPPGEWYDQATAEWVILLQGSAGIFFEGEDELIKMQPGDYLYIPPHKRHRVEFTDNNQTSLWIAVHFKSESG